MRCLLLIISSTFFFTKCMASIPVSIYYEALCSDSVDFITKQLYPSYKDLKNYVTIDFVPYGKAMHGLNARTGRHMFSCQHGHLECKGNMFQACGLAQIEDQDTKVEFVHCIMKSRNPSNKNYIENCAKQLNVNFTNMTKCVATKEGDDLLASNGQKTWSLEPNLYEVPTVILNNQLQIDRKIQRKALADFKSLVCNSIENETKPEICDPTRNLLRKN